MWFEKFKRFPDFGKEVRRNFDVSAPCYDCRKFYRKGKKGCKGLEVKVGVKWKCSNVEWCHVVKAG